MDATRAVRRSRGLGRSEQDKENRGRRVALRKGVVTNKSCSTRTLSTLHRRHSVDEGPRGHIGRRDGSKIPIFKTRSRGRRLAIVGKCKNVVKIQNLAASPSEDELPLKVPTNTPTEEGAPSACQISEDDMIFLMRKVTFNDFFDVSMETESSLISHDGYKGDILSYLKERESVVASRSASIPPTVDPLHREILVDWLIDVQVHLTLENATLHLAVAMVDAYLLKRSISLHYLQLLGLTCLFIASKYEEVYVPNLDILSMLCAECYKEEEFLIMERRILRALDFNLFFPTTVDFLTLFLAPSEVDDERLVFMCNYLVDLTLSISHSENSCPSIWAAAAIFLALTIRKSETRHKSDNSDLLKDRVDDPDDTVWGLKLQTMTGYSEFYLTELAKALVEKVHATKVAKYKAPYRKYNIEGFQFISEELAKWCSAPVHLYPIHNLFSELLQ
eukprot:XP_011681649.1 PREDICTED: cyclin-A3-1 [Strongylocentrotus purpuratus]